MAITQSECFVELASFDDLARYACAFREYPLRVYSHSYRNKRVISSTMNLANTLLVFYVQMEKNGRYVSYNISGGKEHCNVVESTKKISRYAPIINFESKISPLKTRSKITDRFHPIKLKDIGSLTRLTYDPEFPDEEKFVLFTFEHKKSWVMGYITSLDMDATFYQFNFVELESEPLKPFLKYHASKVRDPEFVGTLQHGFLYLPIIKVKKSHPVFGMN